MAALAAIGMLSACTGNGVDGKSPAPGQSVAQSTASQSQPTSTPGSDPRTADGFIRGLRRADWQRSDGRRVGRLLLTLL